jgi:hypothetical protein
MKLFQVLLLFFLGLSINVHADTLKDINRGSGPENQQVPAYAGDEASAEELNMLERQEEETIEMEEDGSFEEEIKSENTDSLKEEYDSFQEYVP